MPLRPFATMSFLVRLADIKLSFLFCGFLIFATCIVFRKRALLFISILREEYYSKCCAHSFIFEVASIPYRLIKLLCSFDYFNFSAFHFGSK
jgi:hypothetical protein